ncbi:Putative DNA-binding domain-containing protein OS=Rhodanobacter lindaniclasticus OX=75310 GN=B1991_15580 PE=4 SV=1 [Rhodanobacter lindaniclasticus]
MPPSLPELQHAFAAALAGDDGATLTPWIATRGIAPAARLRIYRHAGYAIHVEALATSFPALRLLLGEACFDGLATRHAACHGSHSGNLQDYGEDFADFLARQAETAAWPWLRDVARLEWLRQQVALAADALSADAASLIVAFADSRRPLHLRPCVRVLTSAWAVLDLWRCAQECPEASSSPQRKLGPSDVDPATAQSVLLWREDDQVAMRAIDPAQAAFIRALQDAVPLDHALAAAQAADAQATPETLLRPLLEHALLATHSATEETA